MTLKRGERFYMVHCGVVWRGVLHCIVSYCIVLYCIVLYCIVLYCIVLYCNFHDLFYFINEMK